jgi:hypothetical protein
MGRGQRERPQVLLVRGRAAAWRGEGAARRSREGKASWPDQSQMSLATGRVELVDPEFFGRPNVAAIITPDRTLYVQAETPQQLNVWRGSLTEAMGGKPLSGAGRAPPPPPMPGMLDIDGVAEVGAELRVRAAGSLLEALCVAWFRVPASCTPPERTSDPAKVPGVV